MNVSMDGGVGFLDMKTVPLAGRGPQGSEQDYYRSIADQEEERLQAEKPEAENSPSPGLPFPGQETREERMRIEQLKNQAMQIASEAEGGLSTEQESRIKAIEQEIRKISHQPMAEDLSGKAKKMAEQNRVDLEEAAGQEKEFQARMDELDESDSKTSGESLGAGGAMLRQNALVTAIRSLKTVSAF